MFADIAQTPAVQSLARRLENGEAPSCAGVGRSAQPFFAALLHRLFPQRPVVIVVDNLKTQESFQQDLETWLAELPDAADGVREEAGGPAPPLFYPPWEILPHEGKLPHADVISDRLQTLVALGGSPGRKTRRAQVVVTSVTALMQKTFAPGELKRRTRHLQRGDKIAPLDLVEWLEAQGYEPEAQVTQKGELALRGGIVDLFPPTSPWPARLEFFGDELESLRLFDPLTQISRGEISELTIPPAGELGLLKRGTAGVVGGREEPAASTTLPDHLPPGTLFVLCEPEALAAQAEAYARQVPAADPFFISWSDGLAQLDHGCFITIRLREDGESDGDTPHPALATPGFESLDAFRPLPNGRRNRRSRRPNAANFSSNSIAGCGRITRSTSFATTKGSGSGLERSGRRWVRHLAPDRRRAADRRCTSARWRAGSFARRRSWRL